MYGISITYYVLYAGNAGMKVHVSYVAEKLITCLSATFIVPPLQQLFCSAPHREKVAIWIQYAFVMTEYRFVALTMDVSIFRYIFLYSWKLHV